MNDYLTGIRITELKIMAIGGSGNRYRLLCFIVPESILASLGARLFVQVISGMDIDSHRRA